MSRRRWAVIAVPAVALVVLTGAGLALRNRASRPPTFARGGTYGAQPTPSPSVPAPPAGPSPSPAPSAQPSAPPAPQAPTSPSPRAVPRSTAPAPVPAQPSPTPPALGVPAEGVYRYKLEGSESAAGIFQRPFPATATVAVHDRRQTADGTELTFDITYIPREHEERLIVAYGPKGVGTTFEAGSIVFLSLLSQVSQANYAPSILRNPFPSQAAWSGLSEARDPSSGAVSRTERYDGTFVGRETVEAGGRSVETLVYEWRSTFTGSEKGTRVKRYWLDPARGLWVKWTEKIHGERGPLAYDEQATLTLQDGPQ